MVRKSSLETGHQKCDRGPRENSAYTLKKYELEGALGACLFLGAKHKYVDETLYHSQRAACT
jgi:hypothetical protein